MAETNGIKEDLARKAGTIKNGNSRGTSAYPVSAGTEGSAAEGEGEDKRDGDFVRLLRADEIECRVSVINEKGLSLLLFKDTRVDQKILDETFTPFGWRWTHQSIDGNLYCTVEIWDGEMQQWIAKQDVGTVSYSEKEKGQASDSFKRACFNWGVGRELYTAPFIWISADSVTIKPKGDRYMTSERFSVQSISYNEQREISSLVIVNGRGVKVFEMNRKSGQKHEQRGEQQGKRNQSNNNYGNNNSNNNGNGITEVQRIALEKELQRTGVLMEAAVDNLEDEECTIMDIRHFVPEESRRDADKAQMYVCGMKSWNYGARAILRRGLLKHFAEKHKGKIYILPSSVYETILVVDNGEEDEKLLKLLVEEVNGEWKEAESESWLSDSVYYYDKGDDEVRIAA